MPNHERPRFSEWQGADARNESVTSTRGSCRQPLWRSWTARLALAVALAAGLAYLPYHLLDGGGISSIPELERELLTTRAAIVELRAENHRHREQIAALKNDPEAIEDIARDELGMVKPSELVIRVDPAAAEAPR